MRLVEVIGAMRNRTKVKRRKAYVSGVRRPAALKPDIRLGACVLATVLHRVPRSYPGRPLGLRSGGKPAAVITENERTR